MPLETQIIRDGKPLQLRWGDFHVAAMAIACSYDSGTGIFEDNSYPAPPYPEQPRGIGPGETFLICMYPVLAKCAVGKFGSYTLTKEHKFVELMTGEELHLLPGDILKMHRR